ncbi:CRISPR-associated ring nuclease Csm6 [Methylocaldum sp. RMAD-M]|jgi:CRISPR-associated protein (TIGR02584 family)|uniref:CRISPR-associated ring nuclease Csm6 n=2 Tax=unclassified Methylocaldum TaxID=2622260 RepID=UPI00098BC1A4|nr:CRISPR-associated ring nuclease Csm6 [Methylocaldum sp. RMAD-M]MBP1148941.1 CRISPR-associated protein (TIGR02584 family) [Methylocaldum sp. RMAD-M]MVF20146.1 TIGR02584 family CRISPR-associated protein [Methylocaldum sp. BRCS4]
MTYPRRILLVITGLTPQVVTETLFALWQEAPETLPTEIHVISTAEGVERARLTLFSDEPGWFHRLCKDYRLPPIRFGADSLHTLTDGDGRPLTDIRSGEDNTAAADGITEWVRRLTEDDDTRLHVSLAGGRKTLGFFAGYALSLYGRPQDRLSHVLVDAPFESHPGFFYPTPYSQVIYALPPDQKPLDTQNAAVTLADIPFVRLRHGLPEALLKGRSSFSAAVRAAQMTLGPARLDIDLSARTVTAGGIAIPFPPAELAFYAWLARRAQRELPPLPCPPDGAPDRDYAEGFLAEYRAIIGELGDADRVFAGLKHGMDKNYFERRKSRGNRMLRDALGAGATAYQIKGFGRRPRTAYGLSLSAHQIGFCD